MLMIALICYPRCSGRKSVFKGSVLFLYLEELASKFHGTLESFTLIFKERGPHPWEHAATLENSIFAKGDLN